MSRLERKTKAKLSAADVAAIKGALMGGVRVSALARRYGVHVSSVYNIASGRCWPEVRVPGYHPDLRPSDYRKLTGRQVSEIRRAYRKGGTRYQDLARRYRVSIATVARVVTREYYRWA